MRTEEFLQNLYEEKLKHKEHRMSFVVQKLLFTIGLFGLGSITIPTINSDLLLYLIPFVALAYDLYIYAEDFKIKRIGIFIRNQSLTASADEQHWEQWVAQRREPLAATASFLLTLVALCAAALAIYFKISDHIGLVIWLPISLAFTVALFYFGRKQSLNLKEDSSRQTLRTQNYADILIVCGQGTWQDGSFYTEFADRDVYLKHLSTVKQIVQEFAYTHVVCSGGYTQSRTPQLSEARSMQKFWIETNNMPVPTQHVFLDELSLDSAENIYLGLMTARTNLGKTPIRRVGICAAWKFKKARFNALAKELGILEHFYFHGLASADEAEAGERAAQEESAQFQKISVSNDYFLLTDEWARKRQHRLQGREYDHRLDEPRQQFPEFFGVLDTIKQNGMSEETRQVLQHSFAQEIIQHASPDIASHQLEL
jgi:hypothetical protein